MKPPGTVTACTYKAKISALAFLGLVVDTDFDLHLSRMNHLAYTQTQAEDAVCGGNVYTGDSLLMETQSAVFYSRDLCCSISVKKTHFL